jgi:hypothetical protein
MPAPRGNKYALGNKGGRPSSYKPEYCDKIVKWFEVEPNREVEIPHYKDGAVTWIDFKIVANKLPKFHEFAKSIGTSTVTLLEWCDKHEEFLSAYTQAKELQKYFLIENGLNGCYNPNFAIFVSQNITDMRNRHELTGADGKDLIPARTLTKAEAKVFLNKLENDC